MPNQWRQILMQLVRPEEPDAVLLHRFADGRDAEAFAELVRRYEGLVWSQCRHLLGRDADADDAFQATFLALIRSANKIRVADHLGPWLHGVAYRVCCNARRAAAKRAQREAHAAVAEASQPVADGAWEQTLAAVHEEVHRLPESYRVAFVLCYLQGKSTTAAAADLGLKIGTFSARLSRAKQAVLDGLAKRGFANAAAIATLAGVTVSAPPALANRVVQFAVSSATIPSNLFDLTQGVTTVGISKLKYAAASLIVAASLLTGTVGLWSANAQGPGAGIPGSPPPGGAAPGTGAPMGPGGLAPPGSGSGPMGGAGSPDPDAGSASPAPPRPSPIQFEYKTIDVSGDTESTEKSLNRFGADGWELVNVTAFQSAIGEQRTAYLKWRTNVATSFNPLSRGAPSIGGASGRDQWGLEDRVAFRVPVVEMAVLPSHFSRRTRPSNPSRQNISSPQKGRST